MQDKTCLARLLVHWTTPLISWLQEVVPPSACSKGIRWHVEGLSYEHIDTPYKLVSSTQVLVTQYQQSIAHNTNRNYVFID